MSADLTRLRNWFCNSLEDRPSEVWQDSDSNDLIRWDEECRADTESLPTLISEQREPNINTPDLLSALNTHMLMDKKYPKLPYKSYFQCLYVDWPAVTLFRATRLLSTFEKFSPSSSSLASNGCEREKIKQRGIMWSWKPESCNRYILLTKKAQCQQSHHITDRSVNSYAKNSCFFKIQTDKQKWKMKNIICTRLCYNGLLSINVFQIWIFLSNLAYGSAPHIWKRLY